MKKIFFLMGVILMLCVSQAWASWQSTILEKIKNEGPNVWEIDTSNKNYAPLRGGIKICKVENKIIAAFYLSDENIEFYNQKFSDGNRKPIGFEFDIIDHSGVFRNNDIISIEPSFSEDVRYDENNMLDSSGVFAANIKDPTQLSANMWHYITFNFSEHTDIDLATLEVQMQLVGDIKKLQNDYPDKYNQYSPEVKAQFLWWFTIGGGRSDIDGNNFFNIRNPRIMFWRDKFFGWPEGVDTGYDRLTWKLQHNENNPDLYKGDYKPYHCGFGSDPWEDSDDNFGGNSNSGTNPGCFSNPDGSQTCYHGYHTHIIHPTDYRCSKETNGPILCWEGGGDTNCWDAWRWYQFNGDIYEVAEHHNDSNWITTLNRDYTCNEVYLKKECKRLSKKKYRKKKMTIKS